MNDSNAKKRNAETKGKSAGHACHGEQGTAKRPAEGAQQKPPRFALARIRRFCAYFPEHFISFLQQNLLLLLLLLLLLHHHHHHHLSSSSSFFFITIKSSILPRPLHHKPNHWVLPCTRAPRQPLDGGLDRPLPPRCTLPKRRVALDRCVWAGRGGMGGGMARGGRRGLAAAVEGRVRAPALPQRAAFSLPGPASPTGHALALDMVQVDEGRGARGRSKGRCDGGMKQEQKGNKTET